MERKIFFAGSIVVCSVLLFVLPLQGLSQSFPDKPITIYVGFEAGSTTDLTARAIGREMEKLTGVAVVVENKAGGGSSVAASLLTSKKADGYTLAVVNSSAITTVPLMTKVSYDPLKDFTFMLAYSIYPCGICVRTESPFKSLAQLIDHARKNPGSVSYSLASVGASNHLAVEYMAKQAGVKFKMVPFKGGVPAATAVLGGHVDFNACAGTHIPLVKQGSLRLLAVTLNEERDPIFPDVPTLKELGYKIAPTGALVLIAPKGLPDPIYNKLETLCRQVIYSPEFLKVLESMDMALVFKNRRQLETELPRDYTFTADFLKELGMLKK